MASLKPELRDPLDSSDSEDDCSLDELSLTDGEDIQPINDNINPTIIGYKQDEVFSDSDIKVHKMCTLHRAIWKGKDKKVLRYLAKKKKENKINKQDKTGR